MRQLVVTGLMALIVAVPAHAGLFGETVTAEWVYPDEFSTIESHDVLVGNEIELPWNVIDNAITFDIDIGDDYVLFVFNSGTAWSNTDFNGWRFSDTNGTIPEIIGYSIDEVSAGIGGLPNDALGFDADTVWGNFAGVSVAGDGDFIRLSVQFVPAPGAVMLLGLAGLGLASRRRR